MKFKYKKMKLRYIIIATLALGILSPSCNDDFMQREPIDNMMEGKFLSNEKELLLYLDGLYKYYITGHGAGGTNASSHDKGIHNVGAGSIITYTDVLSDNCVYAGKVSEKLDNSWDTPDGNKTEETENTGTGWEWRKLRRVNYFLNNYTNAGDPNNLKKYAAEAYFFKAWDYYGKVSVLGDVPWLTAALNIDSPELYMSRTPRTVVVDSIMKCFDFAIENLDDTNVPNGRVNKDMALFLKARFCLFEGTFRKYHTELNLTSTANFYLEESAKAAKIIFDKNKYELYKDESIKDSYWKLFTFTNTPSADGNKEAILAKVYNGTNLGHDGPRYWQMNNHTRKAMGMPIGALEEYLCEDGRPIYLSGSKGSYTSNPLFKGYDGMWEELDNRDPRLRQTVAKPGEYSTIYELESGKMGAKEVGILYPMIIYETGGSYPLGLVNSTVTGYRFVKHWFPSVEERNANPDGKQTALMFRLGELMLIYAEAKAELGTITQEDLDNTINKLRKRAGFDFAKYPSARLVKGLEPADPRLDAIYTEKLDYSVPALIREIRRERRVELMIEGYRYEDLVRWKAGKLHTVPLRGMKMTDEKIKLYSKDRNNEIDPATGIAIKVPRAQIGNTAVIDADGFLVPWPKEPRVDNGVLQWNDRRYYYPIPLRELMLNPNLKQNPGWRDVAR